MIAAGAQVKPPVPAVRPDRGFSQLVTDVEFDLESIDAELDALELDEEPVGLHTPVLSPEDDQASVLRRMVGQTAGRTHSVATPATTALRRDPSPRFTPERAATLRAARNARIVAIASGKGGVGKTNIAVNTAIALTKKGLRVTLLDADLGTANADVLCGIMPAARLDHVLAPGGLAHQDGAARSLAEIVVEAPGGFKLVPGSAGIGRMADLTVGERRWLVSALVELAADADVVLIDAAAGVGQGVTSLLHAADLAVIVTTPEPTAVADAYALAKCLVMEGNDPIAGDEDRIALVVNQSREPAEAFATHARIAKVCEKFLGLHVPLLGFVAQDVRVAEAVRAQRPVTLLDPGSPASQDMLDLASGIMNLLEIQRPDAVRKATPRRVGRVDRGVGGLVRRLLGL